MNSKKILVYTDGGTRSNPGPGAWAFVVADADGVVKQTSVGFLQETTNNQAEYRALREACIWAIAQAKWETPPQIIISSDSKLVVEQINLRWQVNDPVLEPHYRAARDAFSSLEAFADVTLRHVRGHGRNEDPLDNLLNNDADELCNSIMDAHGVVSNKKKVTV